MRRINSFIKLTVVFVIGAFGGCMQNNVKNNEIDGQSAPLQQYNEGDTIHSLDELDTLLPAPPITKAPNFNIIYYFAGDCSQCIGKYITWVKNMKASNWLEYVHTFEINSSSQKETLLYYLDQVNVQPINGLYSATESFKANNKGVLEDGVVVVLLTNSSGKVLFVGDPFQDKEIMNRYLSVLKNNQ